MGSVYIPFKRLQAYMSVAGLSSGGMAEELGISYSTMRNKLKGESQFTLSEIKSIRRILKTKEDIDILFEKTEEADRRHPRQASGTAVKARVVGAERSPD
jgi:hypothetical protein